MGRFTSKEQLLDEIDRERAALDGLLAEIPATRKLDEVVDGLSVKDLLAHRTEWGRMLLGWYAEAKAGGSPAVPSGQYKWNQLKALNAEIVTRYRDVPLATIEADFAAVHDEVRRTVEAMSQQELLEPDAYGFTGSSTLAAYVNSSTAAHYRSARRHIRRWWRSQAGDPGQAAR